MSSKSRRAALLVVSSEVTQETRATLELAVVLAIVMMLTALALRGYETYVIRAQFTEAFMLTTTVKAEMIEHRAQHGRWPDTESNLQYLTPNREQSLGRVVDYITLGDGGALTAVFDTDRAVPSLQGRRLTFRPLLVPTSAGSPVAWVCAGHGIPDGLTATGRNESNVEAKHLPFACREN